jgi:O-antigen ligase
MSAAVQRADAVPQVAVLIAATSAYAIGRILGKRNPVPVAMVVALGVLTAAVASGSRAFAGGPLDPPLGYANANGALYALGVAAAAIVATLAEPAWIRWLFGGLAVVLLGLTVVSGSQAATVLAGGILVVALAARWLGRRLGRWLALLAPLIVVGTIALTVIVGLTHGSSALPLVEQALTERRAVLWQEALEITAGNPIFGVGPGMFAETSPTAIADADARWAHSAYLQVGAETGILGVALLVALVLWVYGAVYRSRQDPRLVAIGAAAATAFAVHAAIDYIVHVPVLVIVAGLLTGLVSSRTELPSGTCPRPLHAPHA